MVLPTSTASHHLCNESLAQPAQYSTILGFMDLANLTQVYTLMEHARAHAHSGAAAAERLEMMYPSQMPLTVIPIKTGGRLGPDGNRHRR